MIYYLVLTFALGSHVEDYATTCPDLVCVAAVMVAARDSPSVSRLRVFSGKPRLLHSGSVFPPMVDEQYT